MKNTILDTVKYVINNAKYVSINEDKLRTYAQSVNVISHDHWMNHISMGFDKLNRKDKIHFLLVLHSISS